MIQSHPRKYIFEIHITKKTLRRLFFVSCLEKRTTDGILPHNFQAAKRTFIIKIFDRPTPFVVRSLSDCCPIVVRSMIGQQSDNNRTTNGQRTDNERGRPIQNTTLQSLRYSQEKVEFNTLCKRILQIRQINLAAYTNYSYLCNSYKKSYT